MALVNEKPVDPKFFKGHHIVFPALVIEFFQSCLQLFLTLLKCLYRKSFPTVILQFCNTFCDFLNLLFKNLRLPLLAHRDFFEL